MYIDLQDKEMSFEEIQSTFERFYTHEEEESIVKELYNKHTYNGDTVRLESIDIINNKVHVNISKSKFYQLLTTTLLLNKDDDLPNIVQDFQQETRYKNNFETVQDVLDYKKLSNDLAVSVMVRDKENNYVLARRGATVSIGTTLLSTSVTGSVDGEDLGKKNPIENAVKREVLEELHIEHVDVEIQGLFIGEEKLQPVFICNAYYDGDFDDDWLDKSVQYSKENKYFNKVSLEELREYRVARGRLSEAGEFHIDLIRKGQPVIL